MDLRETSIFEEFLGAVARRSVSVLKCITCPLEEGDAHSPAAPALARRENKGDEKIAIKDDVSRKSY